MASEYRFARRVEFAETDMAGIMHFANFFRFMEAAEHEFFAHLGLDVHTAVEGSMVGMARIEAHCEYLAPLHFGDQVEVQLRVRAVEDKTLTYDFLFRRIGPEGDRQEPLVARGRLKVIRVRREPGAERIRAVPLEDSIRSRIEAAPADPLSPSSRTE